MADDKRILNKEQLEAVQHGGGPLLIIAGAGTGKTTVITERIKYLILKKDILPSEILALTFTDKAAREMEKRVDIALPMGFTQMWILTFHSFCDRILRNEALHVGLSPAYRLMTEAETILFLRKNLFKFELDYFRPLGNPTKFLEGMLQHFSRLKDEDLDPSQYLKYAQKLKVQEDETKKTLELVDAYKIYEEIKTKEGVMDFADLISNTLKLFRTRKNVLKEYQDKFKYILVDEFQDTNYAQNELAILLSSKKQNITVVGDDDQAIYRWRGAAIANIIQFRNHFPRVKIVTLVENYRSTTQILDMAYKLIQYNNPDRLEVKEKINKRLISLRKVKGLPVEFIYAKRVENEADLVAKKIKELVKDYQYKDIAILVRANNHADPFVRAFERAGIPYQFLGPGQLFRQEEIKDLIAYLKILYNFEDNVSLYRVLAMEYFSILPRDLAAILNYSKRKNLCLFEALEKIDEIFVGDSTKDTIEKIVAMTGRHLKVISKETAGQILYYFLQDSGILKKIVDYKTQKEERKVQNISRFFDKLKTYEVEHEDATVHAIVDWIDLSLQMGESPLAADIDWTENNAVNILTIHSSKGLEFKAVFLVNLVTGRFPTRERSEQIPVPEALIKEILPAGDYHEEEERRLFYVGMTRSRDLLFLTAANYYGEGKREQKLSPFVYEALGEKAIKQSVTKQYNNEAMKQLTLIEWQAKEVDESTTYQQPRTKFLVDYLSYSQIETFNVCPLHYKAKYILKLQVPQTAAQSFGTSLHLTLCEFYQRLLNKETVNKDVILDILKRQWISEGYQSKRHEALAISRGIRILSDYLKKDFNEKNLPLSLELPFQFKIEGLKIGGKIDRIDNPKFGTLEIIDYKTGVRIPEPREVDKSLQLTIYALAASEVTDAPFNKKKPEAIVLSFHFLENGQKITTTRTKEQLEQAKKELLEKAQEISQSSFQCRGGSFCLNCEYKMLCG